MLPRPFDRFLAAGEGNPHRRVRLLIGPRPDGDVLEFPELALVGEHVLCPGLDDDLVGLLEPGAGFRRRDVEDPVLSRCAAGEARQDAAPGHEVGHRQLFGDTERIVHRQQIAEYEELELLRTLRGGGRHHVRRIHEAMHRRMMLVEADAVESQPVHFLPRLEMLLKGARAHLRIEISPRQRIGDVAAGFELVELPAIGHQVEHIHLS